MAMMEKKVLRERLAYLEVSVSQDCLEVGEDLEQQEVVERRGKQVSIIM